MVEFALILPILCVLLLAAVDFARVSSAQQRLEHAAHLATLMLLKDASYSNSTILTQYIRNESGLTDSPISATVVYTADPNGDNVAVVTANYGYRLLLPGLQNLRTRQLSDGQLHVTVQAAGLATTNPPTIQIDHVNGNSGHIEIIVTAPSDATTPRGITLACTLRNSMGQLWASDSRHPCPPTLDINHNDLDNNFAPPDYQPSTVYTATVTQPDGITSAPVACRVGSGACP